MLLLAAGSQGPALQAAETRDKQTWTIEALVSAALANNPELQSAEAQVAEAKGERVQAGKWKNPEFSGEMGGRRTGEGDGYTSSIGLAQTFEFPGKASLRKAIADRNVVIAELGLAQFRLALSGQIRNLATEYLMASASAEAAGEVSRTSEEIVKVLGEQPALGAQQKIERRVIEGSLIELRSTTNEFLQRRDEAQIELNVLLGRPANAPLEISDKLVLPDESLSVAKLTEAALDNNLQLKIHAAELERAARSVSAARLETAPDFNIGPFYSRDDAGGAEENFGASVSFSMPIWDRNTGGIAAAKARQAQAEAAVLQAQRELETQLTQRIRGYNRSKALLSSVRGDLVTDLREAASLADQQFRIGAISVQLYLEAQQQLLNSQSIRNEAMLEAWQQLLDIRLLTTGAKEVTE
jgi:cobalt-zinc-cadmium efflux system outer membrane protein